MKLGIGLPNPVPGTPGKVLIEWSRRAEAAGFAGLATIDRVAYPSYESLIALAAAAAVTERIGLFTNILLGPTRNPVLLAKEAASVDQLSGGRLTLGLGVGSRPDDYSTTEQDFDDRGKRFDEELDVIHRAWRGELVGGALNPVGPTPVAGDRVPVLIGGTADAAIRRVVRWAEGWTVGGSGPEQVGDFVDRLKKAWHEAEREGQPRIAGLSYFGLGDDALDVAKRYLGSYYGDFGTQFAERIPKTPEAITERVEAFERFGFDELYLVPTDHDVELVDRLAGIVHPTGIAA
jgi:alkanesulfonate monooxygenase SsuD/methylene tetrahydromethanopterin reductase-like flavin-dependent oxidoreductase (luciferase family)